MGNMKLYILVLLLYFSKNTFATCPSGNIRTTTATFGTIKDKELVAGVGSNGGGSGTGKYYSYSNGVTPTFADLDGDGDLDLITGDANGDVRHYVNVAGSRTWDEPLPAGIPYLGGNVGSNAAPALADLDGDGDFDLIIGSNSGDIVFYENTGTADSPTFTQRTGAANPFDGVNVGSRSAPAFGDVDGDDDLDLVVGAQDGTIYYYENTGSNTFTARTGAANPFNGINVGSLSMPTLVDLYGDGYMELVVGRVGST